MILLNILGWHKVLLDDEHCETVLYSQIRKYFNTLLLEKQVYGFSLILHTFLRCMLSVVRLIWVFKQRHCYITGGSCKSGDGWMDEWINNCFFLMLG